MMRGQCKLCQQIADLRESHLLAAGVYRLARSVADANPHPVVTTSDIALKTSREVRAHLLCGRCEQLFSARGEDWVLKNCLRDANTFPLQDALFRTQPVWVHHEDNFAVFAGAPTSGVDPEQLTYFGASVFWRAGAHRWTVNRDSKLKLVLGPYQEELRLFLLDQRAFPQHAALIVSVGRNRILQNASALPTLVGRDGRFRTFWFKVPGVTFLLLVGRGLTQGQRDLCIVRSAERRIFVADLIDDGNTQLMLKLMSKVRVHPNVRHHPGRGGITIPKVAT